MRVLYIIAWLISCFFEAISQNPGWQNLDIKKDSVFGISNYRAGSELLKGRKATKIIVAVIDNGIDTSHEDLRTVLWTNSDEIPGNGIDDDQNGFVDDIHGWNFLGTEYGLEDITSLANRKKEFYDSLSYNKVPSKFQSGYQNWRKLWTEYNAHIENANTFMTEALATHALLQQIVKKIGKSNPELIDFKNYLPENEEEKYLCKAVINQLPKYNDFMQYRIHEFDSIISKMEYHNSHGLNINGDTNSENENFRMPYGDNDVCGPFTLLKNYPGPFHGTLIAGILVGSKEATSETQKGHNNILVMPIRVMSFYRELRDLDLANAIRYATDNGAKIINLSFGKYYTYNKNCVDEAIKYAAKKNVLIVHAAGNAGVDIDKQNQSFYPNKYFSDDSVYANNWITVGASGYKDDSSLVAPFSNYGKNNVDVFAPGIAIYSAIPIFGHKSESGTSMATPIVSGLAALIMEYYPKLTAVQVKEIIMKSVVKRDILKDKCVSGGVVNAYNALKLAATYK